MDRQTYAHDANGVPNVCRLNREGLVVVSQDETAPHPSKGIFRTRARAITLSPRLAPGDVVSPRRGVADPLTAQLSLTPLQWGVFFNDKIPEKTDAGAEL
jgi:hypothetical protein